MRLGLRLGNVRAASPPAVFGRLQMSLGNFGYVSVVFEKTQHSQYKNLTPVTQKKLAGTGHPNQSSEQWNSRLVV